MVVLNQRKALKSLDKKQLKDHKNLKKEFKIIMWDIISWDFKENISSNKIYRNVINNVENGSIIVFHNNLKSYKNLKNSLEIILEKLKEKEYQFSTTW